jgi:DNA-binding MarR family transcriptional regulator
MEKKKNRVAHKPLPRRADPCDIRNNTFSLAPRATHFPTNSCWVLRLYPFSDGALRISATTASANVRLAAFDSPKVVRGLDTFANIDPLAFRWFPARSFAPPRHDKQPPARYTSIMKPFEESTKSYVPVPASPSALTVSADSCAALLLETAPRVLRAVRTAIATAEMPALTIPQFRALHFIQDHPGASLSETADFIGLTLPSTSKLVDQLVRRGVLARVDASDDRRRMILRITAKGDALLGSAQSLVRQHLAGMLKRLSSAELAALHNTLGLLRESFPPHHGPPVAPELGMNNGKINVPRESKSAPVKNLPARGITA